MKVYLLACVLILSSTISYAHVVEIEGRPCLTPKNDIFYICEDFIAFIDSRLICIPEGFKTDLSSVPFFLRWKFDRFKTSTISPAIIHDYMYRCVDYSRKYADEVFYDALINEGASHYTASLYYYAVRVFGGFSYHKKECLTDERLCKFAGMGEIPQF